MGHRHIDRRVQANQRSRGLDAYNAHANSQWQTLVPTAAFQYEQTVAPRGLSPGGKRLGTVTGIGRDRSMKQAGIDLVMQATIPAKRFAQPYGAVAAPCRLLYNPCVAIRQRRLEPLIQRLGRWADTALRRRWVKRQRVYLVEIGSLRVKRIEMLDSARAESREIALRSLAGRGVSPALIVRHHADLWVEYVEGAKVGTQDADLPERLAALLGGLYQTATTTSPTAGAFGADAVRADLELLARSGALARHTADSAAALIDPLVPPAVWVGCDHTDLLVKNMLRRDDGSLCLIDVESLVTGEAVGTGFAKACARWIGPRRDGFIAALRAQPGIPDFLSYFPYLEIRFLASWSKRSLLLDKPKLVQPALFDEWIARNSRATAPK